MAVSALGVAQSPAGVVPITAEPHHRIRFDNGRVRMSEVILPKGEATLAHEHRFDSFSILFRSTEILNEPFGTEAAVVAVTAGDVLFASTADGPYSHRVSAAGKTTFHVVAMEVLTPAPARPDPPAHLRPPFAILLENSRGRAFRVRLEAGKASEAFTRAANSALFAISGGRISEHGGGMPARIWDFEPGHFRWFDASERLVLKNESAAPIHLVAVEVF